jgi:phospholipid N-methyltransferase
MKGLGNGRLLFARNFVKHPGMLGSFIPSSRALIDQLLAQTDWSRVSAAVEYGPGIGTFTKEILARMAPDSRLLAIETNADFVDYLRAELPDRRLLVEHGSAADVGSILQRHRLHGADCIISGIPFSVMPDGLRRQILVSTRGALGPNGVFLVYQFSSKVEHDLDMVFDQVEHGFVLRNVLPAHWYACRSRAAPVPAHAETLKFG